MSGELWRFDCAPSVSRLCYHCVVVGVAEGRTHALAKTRRVAPPKGARDPRTWPPSRASDPARSTGSSGATSSARPSTTRKLAEALGVDPMDLMGIVDGDERGKAAA